jgi:hypothetical protein
MHHEPWTVLALLAVVSGTAAAALGIITAVALPSVKPAPDMAHAMH